MSTSYRWGILALAFFATAAHAQIDFQGLDLGGKKKKTTKKREAPARRQTPQRARPRPTPAPEPPPVQREADLTPTPATPEPTPAPPPPPVRPPPPPPPPLRPQDRAKLNAGLSEYRSGTIDRAAVTFYEIIAEPAAGALHTEAQYWLAKCLYKLGMYHSSLAFFSKVLEQGPSTPYFQNSLEWLFFIARKTVNETAVLDIVARYANAEFPPRFRSEFRYLLGRYNFVRGRALDDNQRPQEADLAFADVLANTRFVPRNDAFYPQAKYLEGLALARNNKEQEVVEVMKEVIRATRRAEAQQPGARAMKNLKRLRELASMQLARIHYQARQNRAAIFYYSKIERGGPDWLEALLETSWAHYRIGQYEQALGNLVTLSSPFFRDEYYPEALILKAVIYFENCRYPEALAIVKDFERIYTPVQVSLQALVDRKLGATAYFSVFDTVRRKKYLGQPLTETEKTLERILNLALTDRDLKKTVDSISEMEREIDSLSNRPDYFKFSRLSAGLLAELKAQREQLVLRAGSIAQAKLDFELQELRTMRANGLRIKFDTVTKEKEFLEQKLTSGGEQAAVRKYELKYAVPDDYLYWPFDGEYWRDELGTYQYTLTKGCIDRSARGER